MSAINNLLDTLHSAHCDNAKQAHYAMHYPKRSRSTMPATSFVYEFFLFNSIYQYDWQRTLDEGDLRPWPPDAPSLSESFQQRELEKFIRNKCQEDTSILRRAFDPIKELDDLNGEWTQITPDARITIEQGRSFFTKLAKLANHVRSDSDLKPTGALFKLINDCRFFVYLVRNNIFHGSKSIGEIYEKDQARRLEVYDIFLKCLCSLFFLAVGKSPVAADYVQLPICIPLSDGDVLSIGNSKVLDCVSSGAMKPEDSRLIRSFRQIQSSPPPKPDERAAMFYPSAGKDLLTPLLLGLPCCTQFYFYDVARRQNDHALVSQIEKIIGKRLAADRIEGERVLRFELAGIARTIHLVCGDNRAFLTRDVDLAFYFHRGDSSGEGGSEQEWDSRHIVDLGKMIPTTHDCQILTDGCPGGVHPGLCAALKEVKIPISHRGRTYYYGVVSGEFLRQLK